MAATSTLPLPNTGFPPGFKTPQMLLEESIDEGVEQTDGFPVAGVGPAIELPTRRSPQVASAPAPAAPSTSEVARKPAAVLYLDTPVLEIALKVLDYGKNTNLVTCLMEPDAVPSFKPSLYTQRLSLRYPDGASDPVYIAGPSFVLQASGKSVLSFFIDIEAND